MTMGRVLLFLSVLESERMEPSTPSQPALGAFVYVEGGKLYYEERGIGPEAFSTTAVPRQNYMIDDDVRQGRHHQFALRPDAVFG